jgi:hypothetical protein
MYAHAPAVARIPNDVDLYWNGSAESLERATGALTHHRGRLRFDLVEMTGLLTNDAGLRALDRLHLAAIAPMGQVAHRFWLDIATTRYIRPARRAAFRFPDGSEFELSVITRPHLLAEKLWTYAQSASALRHDYRWTDLYDIVALLLPDVRAGRVASPRISAACQRYFAERGRPFSADVLLTPPMAWRSAWLAQTGPVARCAPSLRRASELIHDYFRPLLRDVT